MEGERGQREGGRMEGERGWRVFYRKILVSRI